MADVEIRFERENLEGIVPIGTYIGDAMRRFGIKIEPPCDIPGNVHECVVTIKQGEDLLSERTQTEKEHFGSEDRRHDERLACQARIERPGEIVVMTQEKKKTEETKSAETGSDEYRKQFTELPLERKIADLVRLEAIAFGETFSFILNSPFKVFEKVGDVMAEFGMKMETEAKKAQRPAEHTEETSNEKAKGSKARSRHKNEKHASEDKNT